MEGMRLTGKLSRNHLECDPWEKYLDDPTEKFRYTGSSIDERTWRISEIISQYFIFYFLYPKSELHSYYEYSREILTVTFWSMWKTSSDIWRKQIGTDANAKDQHIVG